MSEALPPGWYEDPWHAPGMRWWDGHQWTTHTVVPIGQLGPPPAAAGRVVPAAAPPAPRRAPWWVWTLAVLGVLVPVAAFAAIIVAGSRSSTEIDYTPPLSTPATPAPVTPPSTSYQPPHSLRAGPAAPGEPLRISTRTGEIRVAVLDVVDPVDRGGYYRGPRAGTRWVGVRLKIANVGSTTYQDDPANDTRLLASGRILQADSALLTTCDVFPVSITLAPGDAREGCVIFEVPTGASPRQLRFASDSYFGPELGTFVLGH